MSVEEVFRELQKDIQHYRNSGGGITISGGEPLDHPEFTIALLEKCREAGIHTCIDTSGYAKKLVLEQVLPYVSLFLFDIKHIDPIIHSKITARSNEPILRNLEIIINRKIQVIVRVPIIPSLTDSIEQLIAIAGTVAKIDPFIKVNLMPYHRFGLGKYKMLDRRYKLRQLKMPSDLQLQQAKEVFDKFGINCDIRI